MARMTHAQLTRKNAIPGPARPARRRLRPGPAIQAGLAAGIVALLLMQFFGIVVYDESPWRFPRMLAAMARGPSALQPEDEFDAGLVALGATLFLAICVLYSLALSGLLEESPRRFAPALGIAFGLALYVANFHGLTAIFPWLVAYRTLDTVLVHAFFGFAAARGYSLLRRR